MRRHLALCAVLVACSSSPPAQGPANQQPKPAGPSEGTATEKVRLIFDPAEASGQTTATAIDRVRARVATLGLTDPVVSSRPDGSIAVELAAADAEKAPEVVRALLQRGALALHVVDSGAAEMQKLHAELSRRGSAQVLPETDNWLDHKNQQHTDYYVKAATREAVAAAFDGVVVADRTVGFERVVAGGVEHWRSYWLETPAILTNDAIADTEVAVNETTGQPEVVIELVPDAATRFAEATAKNLGKKIAIVIDGEVRTAPIVMAKIEGGRISLAMGMGDPKEAQAEAAALAWALENGPMPALKLRRE